MNDKEQSFISIDLGSVEFDTNFKNAPMYEKYAIVEARPAKPGEKIVTRVNTKGGTMEETKNQAGQGDFIVTNPGGEEYIIKSDKFSKLYEKLPDGKFKAMGEVRAIKTDRNVAFTAPWGEKMNILAGGYLVDNNGDRYGIEESIFKMTYRLKE